MKLNISEEIEIPEEIDVDVSSGAIKIADKKNSVNIKTIFSAKKEGNKIIIKKEKATKRDKRIIKTGIAHIKNAIAGLKKSYAYKLHICSVHFPMNVSVHEKEVIIKNFLGEVKERKAKILEGVNVKIDKEFVIVEGHNKEKVGQTAANIENAARIRARDRRVFQDGIFIVEKEKGVRKN
ncbi:50S ribosomal protein L6 [archaeon]|nr:50S ribosomal protein L6 [archaeon]